MAIKVALHDESGRPFPQGLGVELLKNGQVIETAMTDDRGQVSFQTGDAGPHALRMQATDALASPKGASF